MTKMMNVTYSRRAVVRGAAVIAGGGVLAIGLPGAAPAQDAKASKSAAQYQAVPKGKARCDGCVAFEAPSACKVVAGPVSPSGWCVMFAAKS
jgi:hypothetical protein